MNYKTGEEVRIGDTVRHKAGIAEVVPTRAFFKSNPANRVCIVILPRSPMGFHTYKTMHLPKDNGGCAFVSPFSLKFLQRGIPGKSVFDAPPVEKKRRREEDDDDYFYQD